MTDETVERQTIDAVARIVRLLDAAGVRSALVGAAALAVHGYSRTTDDIDVGVAIGSLEQVRSCAAAMQTALPGFVVATGVPDADDPLEGVITLTAPSIRRIQIVNFVNPIGIGDHPGREAIVQAQALSLAGAPAAVVDIPHLVAMKLFAGGMKSKADVVELLAYNPDADLDEIGRLCERFRLSDEWRALLPEIMGRRGVAGKEL